MSEKSPISILQEHYTKLGLVPQYTAVDEGNGIAGPFTMKVEVDGLSAIGSGLSKKIAKHHAASALLKQLKHSSTNNKAATPDPKLKTKVDTPVSQTAGLGRPVRPNFVGKLLEYLIKRKAPPPKYELVSEDGPPHMRQFTMRCILNDMEEQGTAKSKQEAKNIAAEKIWESVQSNEEEDDASKPKRRKLVTDETFDEVLKKFRTLVDEMAFSFKFEEETAKEYAIDAAGNADDFSKYSKSDRKMFAFLGTRSFVSLLPEKTSLILTIDSGTESHTIGARGWTRRDAMYKALVDALDYLSKANNGIEKSSKPDVSET